MTGSTAADRSTAVDWAPLSVDDAAGPLVRTVPSVEVKLEHPDLDPTSIGEASFPDAVPYRADGEARIFYWRGRLPPGSPAPGDWTGLCASTHGLAATRHGQVHRPTLLDSREDATEVVVDGTVAGDATTALVAGYTPPTVEVRHVTPDGVEVAGPEGVEVVPPGTRRRIDLPAQSVRVGGGPVETTPELFVRFPGERTLYHPAPGADYALFPSFGLALEELPRPVRAPTRAGELDHEALAAELGVDLSARPYPERVLWQAFAYEAFDPHGDGTAEIGQFPDGQLFVR